MIDCFSHTYFYIPRFNKDSNNERVDYIENHSGKYLGDSDLEINLN